MVKPGLTLEEHRLLGADLSAMQARLTSVVVQIGNSYPVDAKVVRRVNHVSDALSDARCELDKLVFQEHDWEATPEIYYADSTTSEGRKATFVMTEFYVKRHEGESLCLRQIARVYPGYAIKFRII